MKCIVLFALSFLPALLHAQQITTTIQEKKLNEISGLATSKKNPFIFWMHNDSGDGSFVYAVNSKSGKLVATVDYKRSVNDCEDIAFDFTHNQIFVGDIGDNRARRKWITVYKIQEPVLANTTKNLTLKTEASALNIRYPDGPRDAETLMFDPVENLLYIISKREDTVGIYTTSTHYNNNDTVTLKKRGSLYFAGSGFAKWITAGDISDDGKQVLIKSYSKVYYWQREGKEPIWQTLRRKPVELPYLLEPQGEAICFSPDAKGYYTTSEGKKQPVYYYSFHAQH